MNIDSRHQVPFFLSPKKQKKDKYWITKKCFLLRENWENFLKLSIFDSHVESIKKSFCRWILKFLRDWNGSLLAFVCLDRVTQLWFFEEWKQKKIKGCGKPRKILWFTLFIPFVLTVKYFLLILFRWFLIFKHVSEFFFLQFTTNP